MVENRFLNKLKFWLKTFYPFIMVIMLGLNRQLLKHLYASPFGEDYS